MNLSHLSDHHLLAAYRVAKTRLKVFFSDPLAMIALRQLLISRGLL